MRVFDSRKTLAFGVLLLASTLAVHAVAPRSTSAVRDVVMTPSGDSLEARITTTGPARYTYFELSGPRRLVVDFHDLLNGVSFKEKTISVAGVQRVRAGLFQSKDRNATRIVFDLTNDAHYQIIDDKSELVRVLFGGKETVLPAASPQSVPAARPLHAEPAAAHDAVVEIAQTTVPLNLVAGPVVVPVSLTGTQAAPSLPRLNIQSVSLTSQDVTAPQLSSGLMLTSALPPAPAGQGQVSVAPTSTPGSNLSAPLQNVQYTGELVSFDVRDLEIKDFFRLISETSGINVVLDPNVSGTLPILRLTDVPWDQALDVVLKNNQLGGQLQGNVLRIATNATLQGEATALKAQADAKEALTELVTHTYILNYTKAAAVSTTLKSSQSLSKRGDIFADTRKNALIVTDLPAQFAKVDQMVKFLDTPAQQVDIEGRLVAANKSFARDLGTQLGLLVGNRNITTGGTSVTNPISVNGKGGLPLITNFPAAASSGVAFLLQPGTDLFLDGILTMAETNGRAKLLSSPRITTQNNMVASVSQGTQIPVQSSVNNTVAVTFINFALNMKVTPQITEAGTILLTIDLENSVPDFAKEVNGIPSVATQQVSTQILIPDGGTAVIGGIYVDSDSLNIKQVPGLGSLPVIGHLFKSTTTIKSTSELFFFVTPKIKTMDQIIATVPEAGQR